MSAEVAAGAIAAVSVVVSLWTQSRQSSINRRVLLLEERRLEIEAERHSKAILTIRSIEEEPVGDALCIRFRVENNGQSGAKNLKILTAGMAGRSDWLTYGELCSEFMANDWSRVFEAWVEDDRPNPDHLRFFMYWEDRARPDGHMESAYARHNGEAWELADRPH